MSDPLRPPSRPPEPGSAESQASYSWPDLAGRLIPGGHVLPVRVYFEDTDMSGVVYHATYLHFMERGRSDFVRLLGIGHQRLQAEGLFFAVRAVEMTFHRPARIDDLLEVVTRSGELGGARVRLSQTVRRGTELLVEATITVVLMSFDGRPHRFPDWIRESLLDRITPSADNPALTMSGPGES